MDYKLNVFADCQNDCVKMSVDTINMKIIKQQQQNNLRSLENVIRTCSKWRQIYSRKRTKSL